MRVMRAAVTADHLVMNQTATVTQIRRCGLEMIQDFSFSTDDRSTSMIYVPQKRHKKKHKRDKHGKRKRGKDIKDKRKKRKKESTKDRVKSAGDNFGKYGIIREV